MKTHQKIAAEISDLEVLHYKAKHMIVMLERDVESFTDKLTQLHKDYEAALIKEKRRLAKRRRGPKLKSL